ncbi:MAG: ISAs1 family transposase [Bdellovibrionota bacterium]
MSFLGKILPFKSGIPSDDTFARVFSLLNPTLFRACFADWVQNIIERSGKSIAIDGKSLRRSRSKNQPELHMVSAWADESGFILAQKSVEDKSNEIMAIKDLLEILDLRDCLVTIDALGGQKGIAKKVIEQGGDYVLALKDNQKSLNKAVQEVFSGKRKVAIMQTVFDEYEESEKGHGRFEKRSCRVINVTHLPVDIAGWADLKSLIEVTRVRGIGEEASSQKHYYISSLEEGAQAMSRYIRNHWGIENKAHWVLDVVFREDDSRIRTRHAAENMAILRHVSMNLIRKDPGKGSLGGKRKKAGWSNDYLLTLIHSNF